MRRGNPGQRRLLTLAVTAALLGGGLAGCGVAPQDSNQSEGTTVDFGDVASIVTEAAPRVVEVRNLRRSRSGFGFRLSAALVTDSPEPLTAEELDAVIEAIWRSLPWEPSRIALNAGSRGSDGSEAIVDLRAAAAELAPLRFTDAGQAGVSLGGMDQRYGDWESPE